MMFIQRPALLFRVICVALSIAAVTYSVRADQQIYTDSLQNGWQDWSWATHDLNQTTTKRSGTSAISVNSSAWSAVSFWHSPQNANEFVSFSFWIHGCTSCGQALQVYAE